MLVFKVIEKADELTDVHTFKHEVRSDHLDAASLDWSHVHFHRNGKRFGLLHFKILHPAFCWVTILCQQLAIEAFRVVKTLSFRHGLLLVCVFALDSTLELEHLLLEFDKIGEAENHLYCVGVHGLINFVVVLEMSIKISELLLREFSLEFGLEDVLHDENVLLKN